jgi:hypothetical protein
MDTKRFERKILDVIDGVVYCGTVVMHRVDENDPLTVQILAREAPAPLTPAAELSKHPVKRGIDTKDRPRGTGSKINIIITNHELVARRFQSLVCHRPPSVPSTPGRI